MERTNEEWGRIAVGLPGWQWMPGMAVDSGNDLGVVTVVWRSDNEPDDVFVQYDEECPALNIIEAGDDWSRPNPDDPATAGCLLALLGRQVTVRQRGQWVVEWRGMAPLAPGMGPVSRSVTGTGSTLGRACIAAADALGRWPGGEE